MTPGTLVVMASDIDSLRLEFDETAQTVLKVVIAMILFGVALDTKFEDFTAAVRRPVPIAIGVAAQFLLLPALSLLLTIVLDVQASIALGMILVACCPPGNISNILTHRAGGDTALSISMTAVSNVVAIFMLPINLAFWGGLSPAGQDLLKDVDLSVGKTFAEIALLIGLPFALGLFISRIRPRAADVAHRVVGPISFVLLGGIVVLGFAANVKLLAGGGVLLVLAAVILQNAMALSLGYGVARGTRLPSASRKAMVFEVGVRNTGLGLLLVFTYFGGLGGMALVAAFWGLWDVLVGLALAYLWRRRTASSVEEESLSMNP